MLRNSKTGIVIALALTMITTVALSNVKASADINKVRLGGSDRYETSAKISQSGWTTSSSYAILTNGYGFADAVSSTPLAKKYNAPILLTEKDSIPDGTLNELKRLNVSHVIVLGGGGVVSEGVISQLQQNGMDVKRLGGSDRFETSVKIADDLGSTSSEVIVATGFDYSDALSISSIAAKRNIPILLTDSSSVPDSIKSYVLNHKFSKIYVLGGTDEISNDIESTFTGVERIAGADKYERNINILNKFKSDLDLSNVCVASGKDFPDALSGSAFASNLNAPVVLVDDNNIKDITINFIKTNCTKGNLYILGLQGSVKDSTISSLCGDAATTVSSATQTSSSSTNLSRGGGIVKTKDTQTLVSELNSATSTLMNSINYTNFNNYAQKLDAIEAKMTLDPSSRTDANLIAAVQDAKEYMNSIQVPTSVDNYDIVSKRPQLCKDIVTRINTLMNLSTERHKSPNGLMVKYGTHDYECKTQSEYEKVIATVEDAVINGAANSKSYSYMERYDNGERYTDKNLNFTDSQELSWFEGGAYFPYFFSHTDKQYHQAIIRFDVAMGVLIDKEGTKTKVDDGYTRLSAYDELFNHKTKCDGSAQVESAVADLIGFNTQIVGGNDHAECLIRAGSNWWAAEGFRYVNPADAEFNLSMPTY